MTLNPENLALIASAYVAAIGLIAWLACSTAWRWPRLGHAWGAWLAMSEPKPGTPAKCYHGLGFNCKACWPTAEPTRPRCRSPEHDISDNEAARSGDYF